MDELVNRTNTSDDKIVLVKAKSNIVKLSPNLDTELKNKISNLSLKEQMRLIKSELEYQNFPFIEDQKIKKGKFLAKGTFGKVYAATYGEIDVALKELEIDKVFKNILSLLQEIQMSMLSFHERVPRFYGVFFRENDQNKEHFICLVFDLVKGESLKDISVKRYKDNLPLKLDALIQLVSIINDLHNKNIIHRDLKPENIIVSDDDKVYLIDFGTSKVVSGKTTRTYDAKGTTIYMGPENFEIRDIEENENGEENGGGDENDIDTRPITISFSFDVWSLGCIISEICSGIQPWKNFPGKNGINESVIMKFLMSKKDFPIPGTLDQPLKDLLMLVFNNDPDERIKTSVLLEKLKEYRGSL